LKILAVFGCFQFKVHSLEQETNINNIFKFMSSNYSSNSAQTQTI